MQLASLLCVSAPEPMTLMKSMRPGLRHRLRDLLRDLVVDAVVVELVGAHAQADAEISPDRLAHGFQHLDAEAHAVLERAAVLVGAQVGPRRPELIDQLLMGG